MQHVTKDHKPFEVGEIVFFCCRFPSMSYFEPLLFPVIDSKKKTVSLPVEVPRGSQRN